MTGYLLEDIMTFCREKLKIMDAKKARKQHDPPTSKTQPIIPEPRMMDEHIIGINGKSYCIEEEPCNMCDGTGKAQKLSGFRDDEDCPFCDGTGIHIRWIPLRQQQER
jgi:DnaJ-class molecular chaperone